MTRSESYSEVVSDSSTLIGLLRARAFHQPNRRAYSFLIDGEREEVGLTYAELDQSARSIGALLQSMRAAGERVLLLCPPGLDYIAAFFGCLYAGAVAVPAYPPKQSRTLSRLQSIAADACAAVALTTASTLSRIEPWLSQTSTLRELRWVAIDSSVVVTPDDWRAPDVDENTLAFLQYTSGSTSEPKGVMLTHQNLLHNSALLSRAFEYNDDSRCVSWLPLYHDMGLIGGVLQPLYGGFPCTLMSPFSFLQSPVRWLQAITRCKATISGGPNFAYEMCVRKIKPEQCATLDLSSWSVAFSGGEPVQPDTLKRFEAMFGQCGFRKKFFYPCYGLAEATLIVCGSEKSKPPVIKATRLSALENNQVIDPVDGERDVKFLVSCGKPILESLIIANPASLTECAPGQVGEVWVSGGSVSGGYWNRHKETEETFGAYLSDTGEGPFLRTGDLGFIHDGELFVTGRLKDLIIIRGRNHYPQDIELTVERCHPALRSGSGAAFSIEVDGEERLAVVHELETRQRPDTDAVILAIREKVTEEHEVQVYAISLIRAGTILKTSSGKIRRSACRAEFVNRTLEVVSEWRAGVTPESIAPIDETPANRNLKDVESWLVTQLASVLGRNYSEIDVNRPIIQYGLDSLAATELMYSIEVSLGVRLPLTSFLRGYGIRELASLVLAESTSVTALVAAEKPVSEYALSRGQQALWFLSQLAPESVAYNLAAAARIQAEDLDIDALRRAFQALVDRHPCLRTTFTAIQGEPVQYIHDRMDVWFETDDASSWNGRSLNERIVEDAHQPFNLEHGPLLRVRVYRRAEECVLLLVVHHIVIDFWSLAILTRELGILYTAEEKGTSANLAPLSFQYTDYVRWQEEMMSGPEGERLWSYWRKQLAGELPVLNLHTDRPRPPVQSYKGASQFFKLNNDLTKRLKVLSQTSGSTLYTTLLAAFQVLLHRYTGQEDLLVGSLTTGRNRSELSELVGYFVNPLVLRGDLSGNPTFETFLGRIRETVLAAFEHQDYPFPLLVERLQPVRDASRSPLFQAMFILQKSPPLHDRDLASFALGETGTRINLNGLSLESRALDQRIAQFDLTLVMAETEAGIAGTFEYNTDLFDDSTILRMQANFVTLLAGIVENPQRRLSDVPVLSEAERDQILVRWNETAIDYSQDECIHHLFAAQVTRTPDAVAIVCDGKQLSFRELNRRANQLAHHLQSLGVAPEVRVGILIERSIELVVGLLAILKAGGAYVPLDPAYPNDRLTYMLEHSGAVVLITEERLVRGLPTDSLRVVIHEPGSETLSHERQDDPDSKVTAENLAYLIYTSGSTGKPKGVMITHRSVTNCFTGMNQIIAGPGTDHTLMAVTSVSFDISVLELFWTLTQGIRVVLSNGNAPVDTCVQPKCRKVNEPTQFSLFYFASEDSEVKRDLYRLLFEGAKFADRNGFAAVWTPERHFHAFGGLYPNPSVIGAALASVTQNIQIRGGSVVLPLHHPIRVAEEWALVDNLSQGRAGIAFASGWHANDFAFFPENYADRKDLMFRGIETVQKLWRGERVLVKSGTSKEFEVAIFPKPIQPELPIWITAAGNAETFVRAGEIGAHVLTHLLGQSMEDVAEKIQLYRSALAKHGHDAQGGQVTLMLHTFVGENEEKVRATVRAPFINYLRSSVGLVASLASSLELPFNPEQMSANDMDGLLSYAFDRYFETSALFGTTKKCALMIERLKDMGVNEVACLIDFGIEADEVLAALPTLHALQQLTNNHTAPARFQTGPTQPTRHQASLMQCTPSMMRMLLSSGNLDTLESLQVLLLGGEPLSLSLVKEIREKLQSRIINMYGPTETTIWSTTSEIDDGKVSIGRPIANTQIYILDKYLQPVPIGVVGELHIGGLGSARGYHLSPKQSAEKFIPNSWSEKAGARLYKTGDLGRYLPDGSIEFIGRMDQQVKIRGHRIELEEIEVVLCEHPAIGEAVVLAREEADGDKRLVAYLVAEQKQAPTISELRMFAQEKLPNYMVPSAIVLLDALPLTTNGKVDRKALSLSDGVFSKSQVQYVAPRSGVEQIIAAIWQEVLKIQKVGRHDNFFDLGGHSLLMAQVHSQLKEVLERDLPLIKLLEHPTINSLAKYLALEQDEQLLSQSIYLRAHHQRERLIHQRQKVRMTGR